MVNGMDYPKILCLPVLYSRRKPVPFVKAGLFSGNARSRISAESSWGSSWGTRLDYSLSLTNSGMASLIAVQPGNALSRNEQPIRPQLSQLSEVLMDTICPTLAPYALLHRVDTRPKLIR